MEKAIVTETIENLIKEIESLRNIQFPSSQRMGKTATQYYFYIKLGMGLAYIDYFKARYKLNKNILDWYSKNVETYYQIRKFATQYK